MTNYKIHTFPDSRIANIDLCEVGKQKHHVSGLVEFDVTLSRKKIRVYNKTHSDVIDEAPMADMISDLSKNIEND